MADEIRPGSEHFLPKRKFKDLGDGSFAETMALEPGSIGGGGAGGGLTDVQLRASAVPVDTELTTADLDTGAGTDIRAVAGIIWADSGGGKLASLANPLPVQGNFFQATQPVSLAAAVDVSDRAARLAGKVRQTDGILDLTLLNSAPVADTGQVAVPVRELSKIAIADKYTLYQAPRVTTAAATDYFDLFNASGSGKTIRIWGIYPVIDTRAATAFVLGWRWAIVKTNTVGTGGVAHTYKNTTLPVGDGVVTIAPNRSGAAALPAQITARSIPTGGAAVLYSLFEIPITPEESAGVDKLIQGINLIPFPGITDQSQYIECAQGEGIKIRQMTATASTGAAFGWIVLFDLI